MTTLKEIRKQFSDLGLGNPRKLDRETIERRIALHHKIEADRAERAAYMAAATAARQARIADRTDIDFSDLSKVESEWRPMLRWAESAINSWQENLKKFTADLASDPCYAFSWSLSKFEAAAENEVAHTIRHAYKNGSTAEETQDELTKEALRLAAHPARSTSPTSNLMEQCRAAALSQVLR